MSRTSACPDTLSSAVLAWLARGSRMRVGAHQVFVVDEGQRADEAVLLVHGFPESSYDFRACLDLLRDRRRTVALDLLGFGLSDKPATAGYSLFEQADVIEVVLRELKVRRAHVVAHDMGTSVLTELLARRELGLLGFEIGSVCFTNGSVYLEMANLTPSQRLLRLPLLGLAFARISSSRTFRWQVRRLFGRPPDDEVIRDMFDLMMRGDGKERLPALVRYLDERTRFADRWNAPLRRLDVPALVVWGQLDPVAVPAIGERLGREIPGARVERLQEVGHFTPLEAPAAIVRHLLGMLDR